MGHTNSTVNYNLPQFVGTDKPSWLGDVNGAFLAIDTAIAAAKTEADSAAGGVAGLQVTVGGHTTQIGALSDAVTSQGGTLNSVTALIGNGTPTTTDQTIIGAINEINAEVQQRAVHTAASGATWAAQIVELKTYFDALPAADKVKAYLVSNDNIYQVNNDFGVFSNIGGTDTDLKVIRLNFTTSKAIVITAAAGSTTINDVSSATNNHDVTLYV